MYKYWIYILAALSVCSCGDDGPRRPDTLVLGHGGEGFVSALNPFPPNTLESVVRALADGADGVELDIQMSANGVIMLFHDKRLETAVDAKGVIADFTADELEQFAYREQTHPGDIYIQRLHDVLKAVMDDYEPEVVSLNIHIPEGKNNDDVYRENFAQALMPLVRYFYRIRFFIESERKDYLESIRDAHVDAARFLIGNYSEDNLQFLLDHGAGGLVVNYSNINEEEAKKLQDNGLALMIYGLKIRRDIKRSLKLEPDVVQTDNVPLTLSMYDLQE